MIPRGERLAMRLFTLCIVAVLVFTSCKPTEGNYRQAYEAAVQKRTQTDPDAELLYGGHRPASPLGAIEETIGGETIYTLRTPVEVTEGDSLLRRQPYRIAVAHFRMKANAISDASRLQAAGDERAGVVSSGEEKYFVTVGSATTAVEAVRLAREYSAAHPETSYIGLGHSSPLLLISPR